MSEGWQQMKNGNMALFSERYGYTKPAEVLIREAITEEIENALCSSFDVLEETLRRGTYAYHTDTYKDMELFLWTDFLNKRYNDFFADYGGHMIVATQVLKDSHYEWFHGPGGRVPVSRIIGVSNNQ